MKQFIVNLEAGLQKVISCETLKWFHMQDNSMQNFEAVKPVCRRKTKPNIKWKFCFCIHVCLQNRALKSFSLLQMADGAARALPHMQVCVFLWGLRCMVLGLGSRVKGLGEGFGV